MAETPKIAVIIPTVNRKDKLRNCLEHLRSQTYKDFTVYVVNNGSGDGTSEMLSRDFPEIRTLNFKEMLGSAGAYKVGLERAFEDGFDWFWLMDDDAWSKEDALDLLVRESKLDNSKVFAAVAMDEKMNGNLAWDNWLIVNGDKKEAEKYVDLGQGSLTESSGIGYLGLFLPRRVLSKVGYPNDKMFTWVDDVDYFMRIKKKGFRMFYARKSLIYHPRPSYELIKLLFKKIKVVGSAPWKEYYSIRNSLYVWMEHQSKIRTLLFKVPKQILLYSILLLFYRNQKFKRLRFYFLAFYHGLTGKMGQRVSPE